MRFSLAFKRIILLILYYMVEPKHDMERDEMQLKCETKKVIYIHYLPIADVKKFLFVSRKF